MGNLGPLQRRLKKDVLLAITSTKLPHTTRPPVIKCIKGAFVSCDFKAFPWRKRTHERNIFLSSEKHILQVSGWRSIKRLSVWNLHQKSKGASEKQNPWDLSNIYYHAQHRCQLSNQIHQHPMEFHWFFQICIARKSGRDLLTCLLPQVMWWIHIYLKPILNCRGLWVQVHRFLLATPVSSPNVVFGPGCFEMIHRSTSVSFPMRFYRMKKQNEKVPARNGKCAVCLKNWLIFSCILLLAKNDLFGYDLFGII